MNLTESIYTSQIEVERNFASAAFISPAYVIEVAGWLRPEMIHDERIKKFWLLLQAGKEQFEAAYEADLFNDLVRWSSGLPTSMGAREYAAQIAKHSYLAGISTRLNFLAGAVGNKDTETVAQILAEMASERPSSPNLPPGMAEIHLEFLEAVTKDGRNILTGVSGLDTNTGGLERSTMSVLAGRPSMGKSSLAFQIARNVAGPEHLKVIYFSLEMHRVNLWARAACGEAGVTWMDVRARKLDHEQEAKLYARSKDLAMYYGDNLRIDDTPGITTDYIWRTVSNTRPALVVIDHLRRITDKGENENKRQGMITEIMANMAKELDCHVMLLAQLNRGVEQRANDKRPMLSDLRDSGEIEENADQVFMLYRDDYYNPEKKQALSETELWIRKFRDGIRDAKVRLMFDERKQWFEPYPGS